MAWLLAPLFLLTAVAGAGVVLTRDPRRQALALAVNGTALVLLFMALQAPDVAFSQLVVGTAAVPLMFLVTLAATRANNKADQQDPATSLEGTPTDRDQSS